MGVSGSSGGDLRFFKQGRQVEGVDGQRTTKPIKYAAAQYTMLRAKLRKLLLIKSVPEC